MHTVCTLNQFKRVENKKDTNKVYKFPLFYKR